ncbi:hypothetical protein [Aeromicrobium sp. UC242_57]|uniref:hypothetical protein n=1 Tax=Aeromicrobium sp. UC242_57 TaxID=3374624 RepID=UPI0037A92B9C
MIDLPFENRFDVDQHPRLLDDVTMLAGEARFRHLYTRPGAEREVAARWQETLGDRAIVRTHEGLEDWFGPITPGVRGRIGDVVVASLGEFGVFSSREFAIELEDDGLPRVDHRRRAEDPGARRDLRSVPGAISPRASPCSRR